MKIETPRAHPPRHRREEVRAAVRDGASLTLTYVVMNVLATIIASYGLLVDSPSAIIGAMVVALLLGPIAGVGLALVDGDRQLLKKSLFAELCGVIVVMGTAFLIGVNHVDIPIGKELFTRTAPGFPDLVIALAGGAAAAIASVSRGISLSLVGVAVATALVPPLSSCSILLARGEFHLALGAFLLAFTNMVAIQFATSVVFWVSGYSRITLDWRAGYRVLLRNAVSMVLLAILAAVLGISTHKTVSRLVFDANVRKSLEGSLRNYPGAYLVDARIEESKERITAKAVVRAPNPFTAREVWAMERRLPQPPHGTKMELRLRRVPIDVMTATGPLLKEEGTPGAGGRNWNEH